MLRKLIVSTAGAALLAGSAFAAGTQPPDNRFYISGMASAPFSFDNSKYDGWGGFIGFGKPLTDYFGLELNGQQYKVTSDPTMLHPSFNVRQRAYGIDGLVFLHRGSMWNPYVEFGAGRMQSDWTGIGGVSRSDDNTFATVGIGVFVRVASHLDLRGDLRFNRMFTGITGEGMRLNNPVASIGVAIPFGAPPQAAPPPPPPQPAPQAAPPPPAPPPPLDSDHDGVPNSIDQCPNTPPGVPVDVHGCAIHRIIELPNVHFAFDSSKLSPGDQKVLDDAAATLQKYPDLKAEVAGYTDNKGSPAYNLKLSQRRAQSVEQYLINHGVAADRLTVKGYGMADPVAPNTLNGKDNPAGRAKNRRVELHILNLNQSGNGGSQ